MYFETITTLLWLVAFFAIIGGVWRAAGAVFLVTYEGVIRRRQTPNWHELKDVGLSMLGLIGLGVICWRMNPTLSEAMISGMLNAGTSLCGVERLCTWDDFYVAVYAAGWAILGGFIHLLDALHAPLMTWVVLWIVYEVTQTIYMPEPQGYVKYRKLGVASATFFVVVLTAKPIGRVIAEMIILAMT